MTKYTLHDNELRAYRFDADTRPMLTHPIPVTAAEMKEAITALLSGDTGSVSGDDYVLTQTEMAVSVVTRQGEFLLPWKDAARIALSA